MNKEVHNKGEVMKQGIMIAGNLIVDHVKHIDSYPNKGMLCNVSEVSSCIGGCAANTVADIAIIDDEVPLWCAGMVGVDSDGEYVKQKIKSLGVNIEGIKQTLEVSTSFTDVMTMTETGERTFFHGRGANAVFSYKDIPYEKLECKIFHMGYALLLDRFDQKDEEYGTVMAKTLAKVQRMKIKTSMDVVSENSDRFAKVVIPNLRYCNYFITNEIEAGLVVGINPRKEDGSIDEENVEKICKKLLELGVNDLVVIHAPEAGWAMSRERQFWRVASLKLPKGYIKGTVGAGDAFCAGMLYAIYKGYDIEEGLRIAAAAAACNLSHSNSIDGMKDITAIRELDQLYRIIE